MIRQTVHYLGRVQGVGFRFTTQRVAARFDVVGYVRNLPDGRVELVAEGEKQEVGRFLGEVAAVMAGHVRGANTEESPATGQFAAFEIRR